MNKVDIVIVNYKVPEFLSQCLESIRAALRNVCGKVIVVDNASNDGALPILKTTFPEVTFIENHENVGFSRANNQGIRAGNAPFVLLLNPDTIIGESTLTQCIEEMERTPDCGAIGVRMLNAHGEFLKESKRGSISPFSCACKFSGLSSLFPASPILNRYYLGCLPEDEPHNVNFLAGAFMFMRRKALEEVDLLDERFFMYGEDLDLCQKMRNRGYVCRYLPIPIIHYKGESESADANPQRYADAFYGAMKLFYSKYHPRKNIFDRLILRLISRKKTMAQKNTKKTPPKTNIRYHIDLETTIFLPKEVPSESHIIVTPREGLYDRLLMLMLSLQGRGTTLITYNPEKDIYIGPGGRIRC